MAVTNFIAKPYFANNGGINEKSSEVLVSDNEARNMQNFILRKTGKLVERPGFEQFIDISSSDTSSILAIEQFKSESLNQILVITSQDSWKSPFTLDSSSINVTPLSFSTPSHSQFGGFASDTISTSAYPSLAMANNNLYVANSHRIYTYDGAKYQSFGLYPPEQNVSTTITGQAGSLSTSTYYAYAFTFSSSTTGYESNPKDTTNTFIHGVDFSSSATSHSLVFDSVSILDPKVDTINIYRTFGASDSTQLSNRYFILDSIPSSQPGYLDTKADTQLGIEMPFDNFPLAKFDEEGLLEKDPEKRIIPKLIIFHQNRLFSADGVDSILRFSPFGRPESFSPLNQININTAKSDKQVITGFGTLFDELVIFRNKSMYALTGSSISDFVVRKISDDFGCLAPRTIKQVGNILIFYSNQGWAAYTSGGLVERISDKIEDTVSNLITPEVMGSALFFDDKMYWATAIIQESFVVQSDSGTNYTMAVSTAGELFTYPGGIGPASPTVYGPAGSYQLKIDTNGNPYLSTGSGATDAPTLIDSDGMGWDLTASPGGDLIVSSSDEVIATSTIMVYDYANNAWVKIGTSNPNIANDVFGELQDDDGRPSIAIAGQGYVYKYNRGSADTDDGTDVVSKYTSKFYDLGEPNFLKIFRHLQIEFSKANEDYTVTLECMYDYSDAVVHTYTRTITAGAGLQQERFGLKGNAKSFSFRVTCESTDAKPEIIGWTLYAKLRSVRS